MKSNKKKGKSSVVEQIDSEIETVLNDIADAVAEDARQKCASDFDPVELYVHHTESKIHSNPQLFRSRFSKGYQILLEEIGHLEELQT